MASRRRTSKNQTTVAFDALSIEGGLLSPDWLARIATLDAGKQDPTDYNVPRGLQIRDEIGRYWRIAQAHWNDFAAGVAAQAASKALAERFVSSLLTDVFGFTLTRSSIPVVISDRSYPVELTALSGAVPVVVAPAGSGLETPDFAFGDVGRKRNAFGLAQEFLNASDDALWGVVSNGSLLRVVRDNASLTRPAWIEADLERIFVEDRFADFAALWLVLHETRFGRDGTMPADCILETWRSKGQEEGTRAREHLRGGVEEALRILGQGFLAHPENNALRSALKEGELTKDAYFQQLLRLVYRFIFLLTVEERGLLHPTDTPDAIRKLYAEGYGLKRLRDRAAKRSAHDRFSDQWEATKIVFRGTANGEPRLGLPALAGLFAIEQCADLDGAKLENHALSGAMFRLSWLREPTGLSRVNWRDMGPEELGSVYEGLLELVPQIAVVDRKFSFAQGDETKGNARKTSGSYYTPDSLVQVLLDSALEPVVTNVLAKHPNDKEAIEALLSLSVVDPACGSGHFLLGAARRLATHVARLKAGGTPSSAQYREALRQVVGRCIYGVDLNPMAVELCKVALWMEALEPGKPLSFLDSHIQQGNGLLGTTPELMKSGIPDEAWVALGDDDKKTASALKKRNKAEASGQRTLQLSTPDNSAATVAADVARLEHASDDDARSLALKQAEWGRIQESDAYRKQRLIADAWCAAFVWPKPATGKETLALIEAAPTNEVWRQLRDGRAQASKVIVDTTNELREQHSFLHWHLAFPQVFGGDSGGFDVVLGNPPWERVKLQELEFFAARDEAIAAIKIAAVRKNRIAALPTTNPQLWSEWRKASREAEGESHFARQSGRFPLCGRGDVNTYTLFAEHNRSVLRTQGRAGFIVPTGIATDDTTKVYFQAITDQGQLRSLIDFQSGPGLFGSIGHGTFKFSLVTLAGDVQKGSILFSFYGRSVSDALSPERVYKLEPSEIRALNPNTRTCPTFRSRRDADLNLAIYKRAGVLWREDDTECGNPWGLRFMRMLDMTNDSGLFRSRKQVDAADDAFLPLVEAKMVHHFNHRYGDYAQHPEGSENLILPDVPEANLQDSTFCTSPRYWVDEQEITSRLEGKWSRGWLLGWRDITKPQNERTVVASLIPVTAVSNKFPLMLAPEINAGFYSNVCSFVLDYAARQKMGGTSLNYFIIKQLPVLPPATYDAESPWSRSTTLLDWLLPRVLELTYTAWDLEPFAKDAGWDGPPFKWNPERRALLRAELDAAFFHLYGLSKEDTDYVMETFPIVKRRDEAEHGEFRTKRLILEVYDAMAQAARSGTAYVTKLVPGPADAAVAHEERATVISIPSTRPRHSQPEDLARFVFAIIYASNGVITRTALARAYALRTQPSLLQRTANVSYKEAVAQWLTLVPKPEVQKAPSPITPILKLLESKEAISFGIKNESSTLELTEETPAVEYLGEWYVQEAKLILAVLSKMDIDEQNSVDSSVQGEDRALIAA